MASVAEFCCLELKERHHGYPPTEVTSFAGRGSIGFSLVCDHRTVLPGESLGIA